MAAALIPLIAPAIPGLIQFIVGLVHKKAPVAEMQLGAGTGPAKFTQVLGEVMTALQSAAAAGQIPKDLPKDEEIKLIIQSVVTSLKLQGLLATDLAPVQPAPQSIALQPGQSVLVTA